MLPELPDANMVTRNPIASPRNFRPPQLPDIGRAKLPTQIFTMIAERARPVNGLGNSRE